MKIIDTYTGLALGDPAVDPFSSRPEGAKDSPERALKDLILSASGWRKVFAANNDEEGTSPDVTDADKELAATVAKAYTLFFSQETGKTEGCIVVAVDTRPTGPAIADIAVRVLISSGFSVRYLFIAAAPEMMAYVRSINQIDGFIYISASHNPIGHNGFKFGLGDGGVLNPGQAETLIGLFKKLLYQEDHPRKIRALTGRAEAASIESIFRSVSKWKQDALEAYSQFASYVISGEEDRKKQQAFFEDIQRGAEVSPLGIIADLNGSARTCSIDKEFIEAAGLQIRVVNGEPGRIAHPILPEGDALVPCKLALENAAKEDAACRLGYVPDCDGDRGNLVFLEHDSGKGIIPAAQEVFAMAIIAELATLVYTGALTYNASGFPEQKVAVAVNGPTSMRIEAIAECFGVAVFRAEVGETNVVNLARELRQEGYIVRILGEGSNGGNITHPSSVRDPMGTVFAAVKLLTLRTRGNKPGLYRIWCERIGRTIGDENSLSLSTLLDSIPPFTTTGANEQRAILKITTTDQGLLKRRYEAIFLEEWEQQKSYLEAHLGVVGWREINYEGTRAVEGMGSKVRSGKENGGLKILFLDGDEKDLAYIWMRGSKTEPVFRILADVQGRFPDVEKHLLDWQTSMIRKADR